MNQPRANLIAPSLSPLARLSLQGARSKKSSFDFSLC